MDFLTETIATVAGTQTNKVYLEDISKEANYEETTTEDNEDKAILVLEIDTGEKTFILIAIGMMVFNSMSGTVKRDARLQKEEIAAFNAKISPYIGKNKRRRERN